MTERRVRKLKVDILEKQASYEEIFFYIFVESFFYEKYRNK